MEEWMARCRNAESEVLQLAQLLRRETSSPASQQQSRSSVGKGQGITRDELVNVGQQYSEMSAWQKRRKLSQVKMAVEKALRFMGSLGLQLQSVSMKPVPSPLPSPPLSTTSSTNSVCTDDRVIDLHFQPEEEVDKLFVHQTLYLLDRFGVSDEFYHDVSDEF